MRYAEIVKNGAPKFVAMKWLFGRNMRALVPLARFAKSVTLTIRQKRAARGNGSGAP
jgi:hypothetical protein